MQTHWKLIILGSSAALPTGNRGLSGQLLECHRTSILIDCGEGTQLNLIRLKKKLNRIDIILISHLHGDHLYGLPGLISTFHLLGRSKPVQIFGPVGIAEYLRFVVGISRDKLSYELQIVELDFDTKEQIYENEEFQIAAFPLKHSIVTFGFRFDLKLVMKNIDKVFLAHNKVTYNWIKRIKAGEDYIDEAGKIFANSEITKNPNLPVSFAYCSDTAFDLKIAEYVHKVTVLYHESTFLDANILDAKKKLHSTASQAAQIAFEAQVGKLILGHFSSRYKSLEHFVVEANEYFKEVILGYENLELKIK